MSANVKNETEIMGVPERLREVASVKSMSLKELCAETDTSYRTFQNYISGERGVGSEFLRTLSERLGVSASWVLTGVPPMFLSDGHPNDGAAPLAGRAVPGFAEQTSAAYAGTGTQSGFVSVPFLGGSAHGQGKDDQALVAHHAFSQVWLAQRGLEPADLVVVRASGDGMEPRLSHGDIALVNTSDTEFRDGVTYVFQLGSDVLIKRLQILPQKHVQLCSFNAEFEPLLVDLRSNELSAIGRVVASLHEW